MAQQDEIPVHLPHYYSAELNDGRVVFCWELTRALNMNFELGSAFKYIWGAGRKTDDALHDLKKAREYIDSEIAHIERGTRRTGTEYGLKVQLNNPKAKVPTRATDESAGLDLYTCAVTKIEPGAIAKIDLGIAVEIPYGFEGTLRGRSGWTGDGVVVQLGTIDSDYRGNLKAVVYNTTKQGVVIDVEQRIAQLVVSPIGLFDPVVVEELPTTDRAHGGFGSTGQ